jgi:hypothetical protein
MNENTIGVLKLISGLTNTVIIEHPITTFVDEYGNILGAAHIDKVDDFSNFDGFENSVGIYDLKLFLSKVQMFNKPEISIKNNSFVISEDNSSITHNVSDPDVLQNYKGNYNIIKSTKESPSAVSVANFSLDKDLIDKLIKAHGNLPGSDTVYFKGGKNIEVIVGTDNTFNKNSEVYKTQVQGNSNEEFEIKIPMNTIKLLPKINYEAIIKHNKEKDAYRVYISDETGIFEFVLSTIA